ncbi:YCF48-related protein [Dawidia soli]|uniref:T9SS type A sorting domain-containing protein n=1 Tax=Dawidia soli TaxID=2782352 RepID=A0AAP2GIB0_9BACT|nr:YCF48-related protein [Dawidia soli]MBT1688116.1 T9SS type A sorting domain-containing protein [Dawidia soli]
MTRHILIMILTLSVHALHAQGGWHWQMPRELQHGFTDIRVFGNDKIYLLCSFGDFWKSGDGGATFKTAALPERVNGYALSFINENEGWVCAAGGRVYHTTNGGTSWEKQLEDPTGGTFRNIHFVTSQVGYICGDAGYVDNVLYKTVDGGRTWTTISNLPAKTADFSGFFYVRSFEGDTVVAVSWNNLLYRSTDGGASWDTTHIDPAHHTTFHEGAYFTDPRHGWVVGPNQSIVHTADFGVTWTNQIGGGNDDYFSEVFFQDNQTGWASAFNTTTMNGCLYRTGDGGNTWNALCDVYGRNRKNSLVFVNSQTGYAMDGFNLYRTTNAGASFSNLNKNFQGSFTAAAFVEPRVAIAVSDVGYILKTTNGGNEWTRSSERYGPLNDVTMTSAMHGVAVGSGGVIVRTSDTGASWQTVPSNTNRNIRAIAGLTSTMLLVAGDSNTILKSIDAGNTWAPKAAKANTQLTAVRRISTSKAVVVGSTGYIATSSDGGETWAQVPSNTLRTLNDAHFPSESVGYVAGGSGTILKSTDGGRSWLPQISGVSASLSCVYFLDELTGWIGGGAGTLLITHDGGTTWTKDNTFLSGNSIGHIYFSDTENGWAFTGSGGILKHGGTITAIERPSPRENAVTAYPNPATRFIRIKDVPAGEPLHIHAMDGKNVTVVGYNADAEGYDVSTIPAGTYIGRIRNAYGVLTIKLVKK